MTIGLDADGTVFKHAYPNIGEDIGAIPVLKKLVAAGHQLVLNTMRSGKELKEAVKWLEDQGVSLGGINENPTQREWTESPKVYAEVYIDDAAIGIPLIFTASRPYVDWPTLDLWFKDIGMYDSSLLHLSWGELLTYSRRQKLARL